MTDQEKDRVRKLVKYSKKGKPVQQTLRVFSTGSNKYRVFVESLPKVGLIYSVIKEGKNNIEVIIEKVTKREVFYDKSKIKLPKRLIWFILEHNKTYKNYLEE